MTLVLLDGFHPEMSITYHPFHPLVIILSHLGSAVPNSSLWKEPGALEGLGSEPGLPLPIPQQDESGWEGWGMVLRESGGSRGGHGDQEEVDSPVRWPHTWLDP